MSRPVTRSISLMLNNPSKLLLLPTEMLHEVVDSFDDYERGNVLKAFMGTNHHLRTFALPLFFRAMHLNKPALFHIMIQFLDESPPEFYAYVRSVKIHLALADLTSFRASSLNALKKFVNLRVFEASFVQCTQRLLNVLPPCLEELEISWCGKKEFPDIRAFTRLRSFRMITFNRRNDRIIPRLYHEPPVVLPRLTTLSICLISHACLSDIVNQYVLPNLRILKLEYAVARPRAIYQFIDKHPKLREVTVAFQPFGAPRLFPITLMMGGSDEWKPISVDTWDAFILTKKEFPCETWNDILVQEMAFTRVPLENPTIVPSVSYSIRELALMAEDTAAWRSGSDFPSVMRLGESVPLFRDVELLTVQAVDSWDRLASFSDFMRELGTNLKIWRRLKKLTIHVHSPVPFAEWASPEVQAYLHAESPLKSCQAPLSSYTGQPISVQSLLDSLPGVVLAGHNEEFQARAADLHRQIIGIAGDDFADVPFRKVYLAPAWEKVHSNTFAAAVNYLVTCCPTLEEFTWFMPVANDMFAQGPRWVWEISKDTQGNKFIRSDFFWRSRRSLSIVVGKELDRIKHPPCFSR
ncbi:hypothetical protein BDZ89DRAFT_1060540 [Hymenopellis radicata]|nr:hypothetical protein BDZ89DRAFT_1060540 [Hymenopellis radicata]